jgi:hypothetical protein
MMELLNSLGAWPVLILALAVYGFFPGLFARLVSLCFRKGDPRRKELIAEVYAVPRWERPFWVAEQFERALSEGAWERLWDAADGRLFNRWTFGDGVSRHAEHPDTFWLPSQDEIATLEPGDMVKLMFECRGKRTYGKDGLAAERMWVKITKIEGEKFVGELMNYPIVWGNLWPGDTVKFQRNHIIDYEYAEEDTLPDHKAAA